MALCPGESSVMSGQQHRAEIRIIINQLVRYQRHLIWKHVKDIFMKCKTGFLSEKYRNTRAWNLLLCVHCWCQMPLRTGHTPFSVSHSHSATAYLAAGQAACTPLTLFSLQNNKYHSKLSFGFCVIIMLLP